MGGRWSGGTELLRAGFRLRLRFGSQGFGCFFYLECVPSCVSVGEFSPEKENLGRVVNPDNNGNQGPRGAIRRPNACFSQIHAQKKLANGKKESSSNRTDANITPRHVRVGHVLEHESEQGRNDRKRDQEI